METLFRWIHLSDIHFGHGDAAHGWDQKLVIESLRRDIGAMLAKDPTPVDAILVTGDIAFSGNGRRATEYTDADATLRALSAEAGLSLSQVFLVPGNHDVNRASDKDRNVQRLLESLRTGHDKLDTALADAGDRALLARRMSAYLDFAQSFAPGCLSAQAKPPEERLYWTHRLTTKGGLPIRVVGLNTAMLSANDQDQGRLFLGREQIAKALLDPPVPPGELVMVLSHHPFRTGWLGDEKDVDAWVRNNAHVHLSGHVHEADTEQSRSGAGGSFVRVTAGATHGDAEPAGVPPSHGYSFGAIGREGGKAIVRVWPRKWSPKNTAFRTDHDNVPDGREHAEHDLPRLTLPARTTGSTPAGQPIEIFLSSCPGDDELRHDLETHLAPLRKQGLIRITGRQSLAGGQDARETLDAQLRSAGIILLLLSAKYLAWDYEADLVVAEERYREKTADVVPILLSPVAIADVQTRNDDSKQWFERLQRLPRNDTPITKWPQRDEALAKIAAEIRGLVGKRRGSRA